MRLGTAASIHINAPREKVWEYINDLTHVSNFLQGWGPIPGVKSVEITSGHKKMAVGLKQTTTTTDGNKLFETVKNVRDGEYFDYELVGFKPPISYLTKRAGGSWVIREEGNGTKATWTYYFYLTSPLAYLIALPIVKIFYKKTLQDAVKNLKKLLE